MTSACKLFFGSLLVVGLAVNCTGADKIAVAAARPALAVETVSQQVTLTADNEPVRNVLLAVGKKFGANIAISNEIQGRTSVALHNATLDQALTAILKPLGYSYRRYGQLIIVGTLNVNRPPTPHRTPPPVEVPVVLSVTVVPVVRAASILRRLYPQAHITEDKAANAVIVVARPDDITAMRAVLQGIDVQNPTRPTTEALQLHSADPQVVAAKLRGLYPNARITTAPNRSVIVVAAPSDMTQIKALVSAVDVSPATPAPASRPAAEAVKVLQARPQDVARAISHEFTRVRASVVGSSVLIRGAPEDVSRAKALIALIDQPPATSRYTQVYRLHSVGAKSVADLISRSFRDAIVTVDEELNAISVTATAPQQQRISDGIAQLDAAPTGGATVQQPGSAVAAGTGADNSNVEVITLKAATPGLSQGPSTSATDIATSVTQALQQSAPDLRITVPNNSTQLILTGSPYSIRLAKQLIDQLDVSPPLVVLDTEVLELDETVAKNLGLLFPTPILGTTYSEIPPPPGPGGTSPPLLGLQPFTRTALSVTAELHFLVQRGNARVLADPRVTTLSGRTATIRAGDTISILTTTGGGAGSIATTQLQTFQTGVSLDITPVVNAGNAISVTLHPVVNSLTGFLNNVPQIATRDTQTTVNLQDNQTLVIGGLIQESTTRTEDRLPVLGDIPIIGEIFRHRTINHTRNELIIVVTPHVLAPGAAEILPGPPLPRIPTPNPLPTLPPGTTLPPMSHETPVSQSVYNGQQAAPLPVASPAPGRPSPQASPLMSPEPTPSAFAATNVYTYGHVPSNTFAGPTDPVKIFYVTFTPTVLRNGTLVRINAITTTNANNLVLSYSSNSTQLSQISAGKWQSAYNFNASGLPIGQPSVQLTLTASRIDGASASIQIPITVTP